MRKIFILLAVLVASMASFAQSKGKITGRVVDGSQKTIESATISLVNAGDSSLIKISVASKEGQFVFEDIRPGTYLVAITAVGHQKAFSEKIQVSENGQPIQLKTIELVPASKTMSGVTVTAKKPMVEQKIDRTVVNVDASVTNAGNTALEVLEKSPGISVDRDGNISLKGKQGVLVMMDGRPTQLSGADLANLLRTINASQLDQIEIMTNPPAKYDAAGNAGIINIKMKKNKQFGYNGSASVNYGQGILPKFNESLNFNYRQDKWNLFTSLNHGYRERNNKLDIERNFLDENTKAVVSFFDQHAKMKNTGSVINGRLGADFSASKNTTVGVVFSGFSNNGTFTNRNKTDIYNNAQVLNEQTRAFTSTEDTWKNFSTNLNFRTILDTTGKELTADFDYVGYDANSNQVLSNYYYNASGYPSRKTDTLYGDLPQLIDIYSGRVDYMMPLKKNARFEAGVKTSFVQTDNNAVYDTMHNNILVRDLNRSNHFVYEENINAAYVNLSGSLTKKITAQLGLRLENTISKGKQLTTGETFDRNYTQLFPTMFLQYKANDKNTWGVNYGKRLRRPNYESMNPFIKYLDRYTYQQGNPNLKPQFSHNIELSHTYKGFLTTTFNYTKTTDIIQQVLEQNEATNETFVRQANIAKQRQYGVSVSANNPINKWWTNSIYVNVFNNKYEGLVNNTLVSIDATTLMLNGTQQFKLNKTLTAELSGWFRTSGIEGVFEAQSMGSLSAGFSQQMIKGKGTLRFTVRDIFWSQGFNAISKYGTVDVKVKERGDSRVINLGFTYRFNKGKMNGGPKKRNNSAGDEQSRVGVGGN